MQCLKCGYDFAPEQRECPLCHDDEKGRGGKFGRVLSKTEELLLVFFLGSMVFLVLLQIFLRNFYNSGITGGDELVRHLVLWIAFFGAGIAARSSSHVKIDVLTKFMPDGLRRYADIAANLFSCLVCVILVAASIQFIHFEYQGQTHSSFLNTPLWVMAIVLPLGYAIISIRFALNSLSGISSMIRGNKR